MEKAYIAGLIDGEGSVMLSRKDKYSYRYPTVAVSNNYLELLDPLKEQYNGSISKKPLRQSNHRMSYDWKLVGRQAISFLRDILPYMHHPEKIRRANLIIDRYLSVTPRNGKYTEEMRAAKLRFEHDFFNDIN